MKTGIVSVALLPMMLLGATVAGVSAQAGGPGAERFVLTGLVVWSDKEGVAWLQEPDLTRNQIVALRIGESVGPWKVTGFLDNGVELDGPAGKVLIPLQGEGGGSAVAAGAPARPAPSAASAARVLPRDEASRVAPPRAAVNPDPAFVWEANRPASSVGGLGEALNKARAERAQRQAGNTQNQAREAGTAGSQAVRGPSTPSGTTSTSSGTTSTSSGGAAASSDGAGAAGEDHGTSQVIQFPVGGGRQGIKELFGRR